MTMLFNGLRRQKGLALVPLLLALLSTPVLALEEVHEVQRGDTLASIARHFDISISQLAAYNGIENPDLIFVGQQVLVPTAEATPEATSSTFTVSFSETLTDFAVAYDAPPPEQPVSHQVQFGETLSSIARANGMAWQSLAIYNGLKDASSIEFGQMLLIPSTDTFRTLTAPLFTANPVPEVMVVAPNPSPSSQTYVMRIGESLHTVALKFDVPLVDLLEVNGLELNAPVWIGQNLRLPVQPNGTGPAMPYIAPTAAPASVPSLPEVLVAESVIEPVALPNRVQLRGFQPPASFLHVVKSGETVNSIASKYGVDSGNIYNFNALSSSGVVAVGQRLKIPVDLTNDPNFGGNRWVDIDLSQQTLRAWNGSELILETEISSGLANTPTPVGLFRVWHMNPSQTMSGPGYSLDNVKYNMYFFSGYAMHGAYWHNNFGNPMSHGCVNMREQDAELLYNFASLGMEVLVHN